MKETVEYLIEYKEPGKRRYSRTFTSFKDKEFALKLAAQSDCIRTGIVSARVVEQRRKIVKVFPAKKHAGGVITPAASGEKGKIDITDMAVGLQDVLIADGAWSCGKCNTYHFYYWGNCQYCGEVRPNLPT